MTCYVVIILDLRTVNTVLEMVTLFPYILPQQKILTNFWAQNIYCLGASAGSPRPWARVTQVQDINQ